MLNVNKVILNSVIHKDELGRIVIYTKDLKKGYIVDPKEQKEQLFELNRIFELALCEEISLDEFYKLTDELFKNNEICNKPLSKLKVIDKQAIGYSYLELILLIAISLGFVALGFIINAENIIELVFYYLGLIFFGFCFIVIALLILRKTYLYIVGKHHPTLLIEE